MSDEKQETMADIVREMRNYAKQCREENFGVAPECEAHYNEDDVEYLADRIEAAWKRERAKVEADALEVGGIVEAARTTEKSSAVGNAAATREAIINIQEYAAGMDVDDGNVLAILDACRDALSAPARNCDLYDDAEIALRAWLEDKDNWDEFGSPGLGLCEWLFASAKMKGEGDGSK